MPRYTDIDLLIDKVEETTWYHINKNGELVMGANSETDIPLYKHSDIKRALSEAPIADVVPNSEVELLKKAYANYEEATGLKQAKQEVAREIFEEMEKYLVTGTTYYGHCIYTMGVATFAELKKKYTEG